MTLNKNKTLTKPKIKKKIKKLNIKNSLNLEYNKKIFSIFSVFFLTTFLKVSNFLSLNIKTI